MQKSKEPFKVWKIDTKVCPCFGTIETNHKAKYRCHVSEINKRVIEILKTLKEAGIPLDDGAMTYSNKEWMSSHVGFHIKYTMQPKTYQEDFWPTCSSEDKKELKDPKKIPDLEELKNSYDIDYYGQFLRALQKQKGVVDMGNNCIRAKNDRLIGTGPIVLWNKTFTCENLKDEDFKDFEETIVSIFSTESSMGCKLENFGFSVCIFVTEYNKDEPLSKAKICIGAKIDEKRFIQIINPSDKIKKSFMDTYTYKGKFIKYQKKYKRKRQQQPQFTRKRRK